MNIMIVSPAYAPYTGVGANRMMSLSSYLVTKGINVIVMRNTPELWPEDSRKSVVPEGVEVIDVYASGSFEDCREAYYKSIENILKSRNIDLSIYSCNPYYTAPVAKEMKLLYNAKYILDFRDLWIKDEALTRSLLRKVKKYIVRLPYRKCEKQCIEFADAVITVTPKDCECLKKQYPIYSGKMEVIYNGFDETRIQRFADEAFEFRGQYIGIFGKFGYYDFKYVLEMLKAVKKINNDGIDIKIVHIGNCDAKTEKALRKTNFPKELYVNPGYLDYSDGMRILSKASLNCLIVHYKRGLGTKLFDYIYLNKPIVYFAHKDSSIAKILEKCTCAFRCDTLRDAFNAIYKIIDNGIKDLGCENKTLYSRQIQNEHFNNLIVRIIEDDKKSQVYFKKII